MMRIVECDEPEDWMPFKKGEKLVWLGDISDMPGHAAVITSYGKVIWGWHSDRFLPYDPDEGQNMDLKLVKRIETPYPCKPDQIFLWLGEIAGTDGYCAVVNRKGKVLTEYLSKNFEPFDEEKDS